MLKFCRNQKRRNPYELDYDVQVTECKAVYLRICVAQTHRHFLPSRRSLNRLLDTSLGENYIDYVSCISPQTFAFYSLYSQFSTYSALRIYAAKSKPTRGNNTLWAHVIDVQIYSRFRRHSQYSLEDPVQSAISYAAYLYDYESLFSNRNHNPLSKPNR